MAKQNKPAIRFKEFTDAWEQRKLGDMMNVTSVKRIHQSDWTDSGVRFLRARDIVAAAKNEEPDDYLYISKEKYEEYSALSGKVGVSDLLVTGVGTIGVPYLVRNLEPLYFKDGNIIWFQNSDKIDGKFLFYSFSAEQIQGFINESAGIGTVGTYTIESGKKTPISLPNQIEQAKVGEFFQQLDNLITLHQRKYDKLTKVKKAMLEKMFPENGSPYPEIRFKGFTDAWKQRKFREQYQKITEKNDLSFGADKIISVANMYFKSDVKQSDDDYMRSYNIMRLGDIAFEGNKSKHFAHGRFVENTIGDGIVSHVFDVFRPIADYDLLFWKYLINYEGVMGRIMTRCTKASTMMTNLVADDFLAESILVPSIQEQEKIGEYFLAIDRLITLHQRKLEKLKNIKKACLEKMFV